jgi:hypothetical protein
MARGASKWPSGRAAVLAAAAAFAVIMSEVDAAGSTSGGDASATFVLQRSSNASTTKADAIQVAFELDSETQQEIALDPQETALWNLSSWTNVLTQLENAVVNNELALDIVQLDVRFNETAQPAQLYVPRCCLAGSETPRTDLMATVAVVYADT